MDSAVAALAAVKLVHVCPSDGLARNGCSACGGSDAMKEGGLRSSWDSTVG
jgi:hypothetical protein